MSSEEVVNEILATHDPELAKRAASAVVRTARNFGRNAQDLARELVAVLKEGFQAPEGMAPKLVFSHSRRTYQLIACKGTRQQARHEARQRAKQR